MFDRINAYFPLRLSVFGLCVYDLLQTRRPRANPTSGRAAPSWT